MARRGAKSAPTAPFDIFGDERLGAAMTAATASIVENEGPGGLPSEERNEEGKVGQASNARRGSEKPTIGGPPEPVAEERQVVEPDLGPPVEIEENVPLKFQVPRSMRSEFQAFKAELGAALGGVMLDDSNLGRALLDRFLGAERERVLAAAQARKGELRRPKNGEAAAMAAFDEEIRTLLGR